MKKLLLSCLLCVSSVAAAEDHFDQTPADLAALISKETAHFKPVGAKTSGRLEKFAPKTVQLKRGFCYVMVLRLGDGARWSEHAKQEGVYFTYDPKKEGAAEGITGGPGVAGPGGVGSAGCPQKSATFVFNLTVAGVEEDKRRDLGAGAFTLQLMAKANSARELHKQKHEMDEQADEQASFVRDKVRGGCARCTQNKEDCLEGTRRPLGSNCREDYRLCLERNAISASDCR